MSAEGWMPARQALNNRNADFHNLLLKVSLRSFLAFSKLGLFWVRFFIAPIRVFLHNPLSQMSLRSFLAFRRLGLFGFVLGLFWVRLGSYWVRLGSFFPSPPSALFFIIHC